MYGTTELVSTVVDTAVVATTSHDTSGFPAGERVIAIHVTR